MSAHPPELVLPFLLLLLAAQVGIFMFAFIVGAASEALGELDALGAEQRESLKRIEHYMVPPPPAPCAPQPHRHRQPPPAHAVVPNGLWLRALA